MHGGKILLFLTENNIRVIFSRKKIIVCICRGEYHHTIVRVAAFDSTFFSNLSHFESSPRRDTLAKYICGGSQSSVLLYYISYGSIGRHNTIGECISADDNYQACSVNSQP